MNRTEVIERLNEFLGHDIVNNDNISNLINSFTNVTIDNLSELAEKIIADYDNYKLIL